MKPTFDDLLMLYRQWVEFPQCPIDDFFKIYHWTSSDFFAEAVRRNIDV